MKIINVQLDLARQKETVEYIKSFYDFAKQNGYNSVTLTIEATTIRTSKTMFFKEEDSYSKEEIKEIVSYGDKIGIDTIPTFQNAGHLDKLLEYPQFAQFSEVEDDERDGRGFHGGRGSSACLSNPKFYEFIDDYILEASSCFTSEYVAVWMDELFVFSVCPKCLARIEKGETREDIFYKHVMHTYNMLKSVNKKLIMCEDFFEYMDIAERLPRDIVFLVWSYGYINDEIQGHWTNCKKRDAFRYYEELGFQYLYGIYASRSSSLTNLETFNRYANKYNPLGACMLVFCRADTFNHGSYPCIAYAGRKWSGQATEEDKVDIYAEFLGSRECAELILSLNVPTYFSFSDDVATMCENDNFCSKMLLDQLEYALKRLKNHLKENILEEQKEILFDLYGKIKEIALFARLHQIGIDIFDNYETKKVPKEVFLNKLDILRSEYDELEEEGIRMWNKYRKGIVSCANQFEKRFRNRREMVDKVKEDIIKNTDVSVLYVDLMLPDMFCTARIDVRVKYKGEEKEVRIYKGQAKTNLGFFETSGNYTIRFAMENKEVEWLSFSVFGEGALCPLHFRYTRNGKKYVSGAVEKVQGNVQDEQYLLFNDNRFAVMGYNDGKAHFEDISLSKKMSEILVKFKPFVR